MNRIPPLPRLSRLLCLAPAPFILASLLPAQVPVRNAVGDGGSNPMLLLDGLPGSGWESTGTASRASFLLDDPAWVEAAYVMASGGETAPAYALLGSSNYRDWYLLQEGTAEAGAGTGSMGTFVPQEIRYLRLESRTEATTSWQLALGEADAVRDRVELWKPVDWGDITDPAVILEMLDRAFSWQVGRQTTRQGAIGWVNGAFHTGVSALYAATGGQDYREAIVAKGEAARWTLFERTTGKAFYHADDHCIGQSWLELYMLDPDPETLWMEDVQARLDRVMADPLPGRVDMNWCDALYMSPPVYWQLAEITGEDRYRSFMDRQWWDVTDHLYDPEHGLFFRDQSYFDDVEPNGAPVFWSRGNGWVIGGLVRILDYMPQDWPRRGDYVELLREMAESLAAIQDPEDGLWASSLLYPEKYGSEREASGSAFFIYGIAYGVNEGLLDRGTFAPVLEKGWSGLASLLRGNGVLESIQQIGAGPAAYNGMLREKDYGYGAFILAGLEMIRYYGAESPGIRQSRPWRRASELLEPVPGSPADWNAVDDFEEGFSWDVRKTLTRSETLQPDPFDPSGSTVFSIDTGHRTEGVYRATVPIPLIPEGAVGTVYQRFAYTDPEIDVVFGLTDAPAVVEWGDYETGLRIYFSLNQLEARRGDRYVPVDDDLLQLETWYEVWTVVDNAEDTYAIYIRGGSNYPERVLLAGEIPFRNGTSAALTGYALSYNARHCEGSFHLDDLFVDPSGVNLTRPAEVRQSRYSPWADSPRLLPEKIVKRTPLGSLDDRLYPWVFHAGLEDWLFIPEGGWTPAGTWAWSDGERSWVFLSAQWPGWVYSALAGTWSSWEPG